MPWSETSAMDQKARFIRDWIAGHWSVTELCCRYGVSRKTGYKWAERFATQGPDGGFYPDITDTSVKPHHGAGGVSCNSEGSTAKSSSVRRLD